MDFRDRDGAPLINWERRRGRVRGLEGLLARAAVRLHAASATTRLRDGRGIQWPCTDARRTARSGSTPTASSTPTRTTPRPTATTSITGRGRRPRRSTAPSSRAGARSCTPPTTSRRPRCPSDEYPLLLTTGRTVYHFHTRTKTGRAPELTPRRRRVGRAQRRRRRARSASREGDLVRVESPRGAIEAPARLSGDPPGRGLRAVPLRRLGRRTPATRAARGQRADDHAPGTRSPSSRVQGRRGRGASVGG